MLLCFSKLHSASFFEKMGKYFCKSYYILTGLPLNAQN